MSVSKEMLKVREELEKTKKEKAKLERAKSTTKMLKGLAETKVVPEEKYCKLEADYDQALQKIAVSCFCSHQHRAYHIHQHVPQLSRQLDYSPA